MVGVAAASLRKAANLSLRCSWISPPRVGTLAALQCQSIHIRVYRGISSKLNQHGTLQIHGSHRWLTQSRTTADAACAAPEAAVGLMDKEAVQAKPARPERTYSQENPRALLHASPADWAAVYFELGKGKLSMLVTFTAAAGFVVATPLGVPVNLQMMGLTCTGTVLAAMGASAFNQVMEVSNDSRMKRTIRRPLVTGKISRPHGFIVASCAGAGGVVLLATCVNLPTAALAAANIALYSIVYTPAKQVSIWNTWVGALVGAIPPMMGWAALGAGMHPGSWLMGAMLFSWQMPHFLSLAYMMRADYKAGGYLMMPGEAGSAGLARASNAAIRHCAYLQALSVACPLVGITSPFFLVEATVINAVFAMLAINFHRAGTSGNAGKTNTAARQLFLGSLAYLPLLLGCMVLHRTTSSGKDEDASCPYLDINRIVAEVKKQTDTLTSRSQ